MRDKKILIIFILALMSFSLVSAVGEISFCCEKTTSGSWCINAPEEQCDISVDPRSGQPFTKAPSSCEATSYCKLGCCYDSQEGTCMENTPERVCNDAGGIWADDSSCDVPQCQLGCCLIGDEAAFVTQTRCKRLSSLYGLQINYRTDIGSEVQCIAEATSEVKGACVFEREFETTCKFTTKRECQEISGSGNNGTLTNFHEDYLCSAEQLGTICGPTEKTTCVEGEDEVYFVDSCGNLANIYDASKIDDKEYWSKVYDKTESCGYEAGNADSKTCGNCDYYLGSTCKEYERGEDKSRPNYGNYICRDLACSYKGEKYEHGESWCAEAEGVSEIEAINPQETDADSENLPGSRYFRMVCYNKEVTIEPCADFRSEVCVEDELNGFTFSRCRVNLWQDCYSQDNAQDCENSDRRDCQWIEGVTLKTSSSAGTGVSNAENFIPNNQDNTNSGGQDSGNIQTGLTGNAIFGLFGDDEEEEDEELGGGACVPRYPPGFNFWEGGEAEGICSLGSTECLVKYEEGLFGEPKCVENCHCLEDAYAKKMNELCISLGDCGSSVNYVGTEGYYDEKANYHIKAVEEGENAETKS